MYAGLVAGVVRDSFCDDVEKIRMPQDGVVIFVVFRSRLIRGSPYLRRLTRNLEIDRLMGHNVESKSLYELITAIW